MKISGTVVEGKKQARGVGYPTANLAYASDVYPEDGVWSCRVRLDGNTFDALAVIGMWKLENALPSVEVHLLDFSGDLYGRTLSVDLNQKLRDLLPFTDIEALQKQIVADIELARKNGFYV